MDGSTHSVVVGPRPKVLGARALMFAVLVVAMLFASFAIGRLTAQLDDGTPAGTGNSHVVTEVAPGRPGHDGDVKRG
jgi:hypothetical protein